MMNRKIIVTAVLSTFMLMMMPNISAVVCVVDDNPSIFESDGNYCFFINDGKIDTDDFMPEDINLEITKISEKANILTKLYNMLIFMSKLGKLYLICKAIYLILVFIVVVYNTYIFSTMQCD